MTDTERMAPQDPIPIWLRAAKEQLDSAIEHYGRDEIVMAGQEAKAALDDLRGAVRRIEEKRKSQKRLEQAARRAARRNA